MSSSNPPPLQRTNSDEGSSASGGSRHQRVSSTSSNSRKNANAKNQRPSGTQPTKPHVGGSDSSIHAPKSTNATQAHRRAVSDATNKPSPAPQTQSPLSNSTNSTLNPNAGGFHPGGLSSLAEVQNEVLITPTVGNFEFTQPSSLAQTMDYANLTGGMNNQLAASIAQLQQLQMMQQTLAQTPHVQNPAQQQQLIDMQAQLIGNMQAQNPNVPPRFAAQQNQDMGHMMAESMAIQQQLDLLRAQQDALLNRFAEMHVTGQQPTSGITSPTGTAASSFANAARSSGGHRRYQSQQVASPTLGGMSAMGQFSQPGGFTYSGQPSGLPKGHGRRHSVNVVGKSTSASAPSPALASAPLPSYGALAPAVDYGPASELDFGASPASVGASMGSPPLNSSTSGWQPGHRSRDSRSSISSLSGWGTNSGQYVQNAVPSATTTDLAQATAQLAQLSQFRASAGHAKVPSFGNNSNFYGQNNYNQGTPQQQRKSLFAPYLPAASIPPLVAAGKLVIGTLRVNKRNRSDAYVTSDALDADIYICGSKDRNRALEGDVVAVELLDVDDVWGTKKEKEEKKRKKEEIASYDPRNSAAASSAAYMRKQDKKNDDVEVEGQGMTLFDDLDEAQGNADDVQPQYAGHVVGVVHRTPGQLFAGTLGVLRPSSAATKEKQEAERREREGVDLRASTAGRQDAPPVRIVWLRPVDKRVPLLAIPVNEAPPDFVDSPEKYANRLFCACIKRWPITSLHPFGTLVEEIGPIGDIETETSALLKDCNFSTADFAEPVLKCLPPIPYSIPPRELEVRRDFRDVRLFTIDPSGAKDLDDALSITRLENGNYEVGVHIADVSYFVKLNVALDREARKRGTTVYLVQRAIHMLPEALVQLCSLTPNEDKLAFSVVFTMTPEARIVDTWIGKTAIRSCGQLSYDQVQAVIAGGELDAKIVNNQDKVKVKDDLLDLAALARQLTSHRFEGNALKLDKIKLTFELDDDGQPIDCKVVQQNEAQRLIEEFMLLANISVAQRTAAGLPDHALLRRHEGPLERRLEAFGARSKRLGYSIDISSPGAIQQDFTKLQNDSPKAMLALQMLITKTMKSAKYFCAGMLDISKFHHYCLNVPLYAHFTSPIRRYADIMVHRQLEAIIMGAAETKLNLDSEAVAQVAQQCNTKKDAAKAAAEASQHLFLCTLLHRLTTQYGPVIRPAQVIGVLDEAFDVVVPDFGIEKRVHVDQMPIENHVYDDHNNTLTIYWKQGVNVVKWLAEHSGDAHLQLVKQNAERHAKLMGVSDSRAEAESALFDDEHDSSSHAVSFGNSVQAAKSAQKVDPQFEGVEVTKTGHHIQVVRELQTVPVIVSADMTKSPPVIKLVSLNPFQ